MKSVSNGEQLWGKKKETKQVKKEKKLHIKLHM